MADYILDEIYLLDRDEKPFSEKAVVVLGGITSFGAIVPVFLSYFQDAFGSGPYTAFKVLTGIYFILPLAVFLAWMFVSRRRPVQNPGLNYRLEVFRKWLFIAVSTQLALAVLIVALSKARLDCALWLYPALYAVVAAGQLVLLRVYYTWSPGLPTAALVATGLLVIAFFCLPHLFREDRPHISTDWRPEYRELTKLSELEGNIANFEKRTSGTVSRYRLKSHMRWVTHNVSDSVVRILDKLSDAPLCIAHYRIKPYADVLNTLILEAKRKRNDTPFPAFVRQYNLNPDVAYSERWFFAADTLYLDDSLASSNTELLDSSAYINLIDTRLYDALERDQRQLVVIADSDRTHLRGLFHTYQLIDTARDTGRVREAAWRTVFEHYLDEKNSRELYEWVQNFNAYVKHRAHEKARTGGNRIAWIYRNAQLKGLLIFGTFLLTLLIYCLLLRQQGEAEREQAIRLLKRQTGRRRAGADSGSAKNALELILSLIRFHSFPAIAFSFIVIALLVPLCKPIKGEEIEVTRPDWFLAVPNWNLPHAATNIVTGGNACGTCEPGFTNTHSEVNNYPGNPLLGGWATKDDVDRAASAVRADIDTVDKKLHAISPFFEKQ